MSLGKSPILLSTKVLTESQKASIISNGIALIDYNAINVTLKPTFTPKKVKNAIFSSKNAVKSIKKYNSDLFSGNIENCFSVGKTTTQFLTENGQKVTKTTQNASELAEFIIKNHKNDAFYFFCGSRRRDDIPAALKKAKIEHFEVKTYQTELKPRYFDEIFDGILFFSPSGVESFVAENKIAQSTAFCIGATTASKAKKYTKNVQLATTASINSTIELAVNTLKNDKN
ncbi:uroporphyrinogen-III synthase [Ulvibacter sp. MAR_2010_11]|uniref:uroporphyrinogen-III synthase n=1 Tax=Ulvibacter sp. MAR_2010_11 TaxID=1250229 RepID=UPI000C2CB152|nr:uroporphyrinogen-III synthase [Ulvibacter sp. MAR_2010_11]PKA82852.1 uroporphyrinogen-III synthase [Ulvibacter sp. MAR_2010_11]